MGRLVARGVPKEFLWGPDSRPGEAAFRPHGDFARCHVDQGLIGTYRAGTGRLSANSGRGGGAKRRETIWGSASTIGRGESQVSTE